MEDRELAQTVVAEDVQCPAWSSDETKYPSDASGYELQREVGHGTTATVWVARAKAVDRFVAVKMFYLDHMQGDKGRAVQEVLTTRSLRHPNILSVLAHFQEDGHVWMVMPFINGGSASSILAERHPEGLAEAAILGIAAPVLRALDFMHQLSIMHRDVKAANVLVSDEGKAYLCDMGVAAPVQHTSGSSLKGCPERERVRARHEAVISAFAGTPALMAPEVVAPDEEVGYDERADLWSFGVLLLELAQGTAPHAEEPLERVIISIANGEPPELQEPDDGRHFSEDFKEVVRACLKKDPAARSTAAQLLKLPVLKEPMGGHKLVKELFVVEEKRVARFPLRAKSMARKGVSAVLQEEMEHAVALLQRATAVDGEAPQGGRSSVGSAGAAVSGSSSASLEGSSGVASSGGSGTEGHKKRHRNHLLRNRVTTSSSRLTVEDLRNCRGLVFGRAHKQGLGAAVVASGTGFAVARHVNEAGELFWSAPSFLHVTGHGVGLSVGAEELSFVLVLRDFDHLLTAAAPETTVRMNAIGNLVGHRVALNICLGRASHTTKIVSFGDGRLVAMSILGWNLGPDQEFNERVYGESGGETDPTTILQGGVRPPSECDPLIDQLQALERHEAPMRIASDLSLKRHSLPPAVAADGEQEANAAQPAAEQKPVGEVSGF